MIKPDLNEAKRWPIILLVITALLWSTGGVLIKLISIDPMAIAGARSFFAAIIFLIFIGNPFKIKINRIKILCALCYALNVTLVVVATKYTTSANAILLQYTAPIYVILFSDRFLGEKVSAREYVTVVVVILGMLLFVYDGLSNSGLFGNILAMLSGLFFAGIILLTRKMQTSSPFESLFLGNFFTVILCSPVLFTTDITMDDFGLLLLLGVFQLGLPYVLYSFAIKYVKAVQASLIITLEPILNPIWVFLVTGERPSILSLIGGSIVVFSIILNYTMSDQKQYIK